MLENEAAEVCLFITKGHQCDVLAQLMYSTPAEQYAMVKAGIHLCTCAVLNPISAQQLL